MERYHFIFIVLLVFQLKLNQAQVDEALNEIKNKYFNVSNERQARFYHQIDDQIEDGEEFDFIIVGSGSAGSVIANRLSENPAWKVLLLEVGEEATFLTDIPAIAPLFQFTDLNWNYLMEKQDNFCLGLKDQRMAWPRGRGLGGTTLINYMIHVRGNRHDYDLWGKNNPGWSYRDVFPYFLKSENARLGQADATYHSSAGYLSVEDVPYRTTSSYAFTEAAQQAGHPYVDYNGRQQLGTSHVQATLKNGRRANAEKAFLRPVRHRTNLKILTRSRVTKLLINEADRQVNGVLFVRSRRYFTAKAKKEVVLSAGAFNSPQILMLSGIGPMKHLNELGIPLVQNLPVGEKLYDHLTFLGLTFTVNQSIVGVQENLEAPTSFIEFISEGSGPLTTLGGVEALLYFKTNVSKSVKYPDMELIFIGGGMNTDRGQYYRKSFRITDHIYNTVWKPLEGKFAFQVLPMLVHPKSYGWLKLKSKNPYHWPKFYGNFFTDSQNEDLVTFIAAIREVQRIVSMPALQKYKAEIVPTPIPGCEHTEFDSDEYWECALRHVTATLHHQVATCKMGPRSDKEAVVDEQLRVYGIGGLRVADTSIIPIPLTAHTSIPAFMVGEKASDLIKSTWKMDEEAARNIDVRSTQI